MVVAFPFQALTTRSHYHQLLLKGGGKGIEDKPLQKYAWR